MSKFLGWVFFPFIIISLFATFLIPMMQADPGYVLIAVGGKVIEMRFWMAILVLLIALFGVWVSKALLVGSLRLAISTFNWWPAKAQALLWQRQERALAALWEGNTKEAHRNFVKILKTKAQKNNILSLINAANTATDLNLFDEANTYLLHAEQQQNKSYGAVVMLSRARYFQKQAQPQKALALANVALCRYPLHSGVLQLLLDLHRNKANWQALLALLPHFKKAKLLDDTAFTHLEQAVYQGLLAETSDAKILENRWQTTPKNLRKDITTTAFYIKQLIQLGCNAEAEALLRKLLKTHYTDELMHLFAQTPSPNTAAQLQYAERWLPEQPQNAELFLALGRIAQRGELWGKAKNYFEKSLALQPTTAAYAELARLLANLGEHQRSNALFQQGLLYTAETTLPASLQK